MPRSIPERQLFPTGAQRREFTSIMIHSIDIGPGSRTVPAAFVESVQRSGVLQPIIVSRTNRTSDAQFAFKLIAGRRRVIAAHAVGLDHIPAVVYLDPLTPEQEATIILSENAMRSESPLRDMRAIQTLTERGINELSIARTLNLSISQVRSRAALSKLVPTMQDALENGFLSVRLANQVARMPASSQNALIRIWDNESQMNDEITIGQIERSVGRHEETPAALRRVPQERQPVIRIDLATDAPDWTASTSFLPDVTPVVTRNTPTPTRSIDPSFRRISENLIEFGGQQYVRFDHHLSVAAELERRVAAARQVPVPAGVERVQGSDMIRFGGETYISLDHHNRLVTTATRRLPAPRAEGGRTITRARLQEATDAARVEGFTQGRESVLPQLQARIPVPDGLTREEIIERIAEEPSYLSARSLLSAASRALPVEPTRRSDELHEAMGLMQDMLEAAR